MKEKACDRLQVSSRKKSLQRRLEAVENNCVVRGCLVFIMQQLVQKQ